MADRPGFYSQRGLNALTYDSRTTLSDTPVDGDVGFYVDLAARAGGPVLELGAGTGRVSFVLACTGHEVVGLDLSDAMLERAAEKLGIASGDVRDRLVFAKGDMSEFDLGRSFALIIIPFRAFMGLLEPQRQRRCLRCIHAHLQDEGLAVVDLFDPLLDRFEPRRRETHEERPMGINPETSNRVRVEVVSRHDDMVRQTFEEIWRFTELDGSDQVLVGVETLLNTDGNDALARLEAKVI